MMIAIKILLTILLTITAIATPNPLKYGGMAFDFFLGILLTVGIYAVWNLL